MPRPALTLIVIALALRLGVALAPFDGEAPDSASYLAPATSLAAGRGYSNPDGTPTAARPPGYPGLLAATFVVAGGPSPRAARLVQALLGALAVAFVYAAVARALPDERVGGRGPTLALAAAGLLALDPIAMLQTPYLLREALLLTLVAALLWTQVALAGRARFAAGGLVLAALALTHQLYILLGPFLAAADLWRAPHGTRRRRLAGWVAAAAIVALPVALWALRNARVLPGERLSFTQAENAAGPRELWLAASNPNLWLGSDTRTGFQQEAWAEEARLYAELGVPATGDELMRRAGALWREHPIRTLGRVLLGNVWYWLEVPGAVTLVDHPRLFVLRWALLPFHWVRLTCAVAGMVLALRRGPLGGPAAAILAFFAFAPAALYPIPRYLAPACPIIDVLAVLGLAGSLRRPSTTLEPSPPAPTPA